MTLNKAIENNNSWLQEIPLPPGATLILEVIKDYTDMGSHYIHLKYQDQKNVIHSRYHFSESLFQVYLDKNILDVIIKEILEHLGKVADQNKETRYLYLILSHYLKGEDNVRTITRDPIGHQSHAEAVRSD